MTNTTEIMNLRDTKIGKRYECISVIAKSNGQELSKATRDFLSSSIELGYFFEVSKKDDKGIYFNLSSDSEELGFLPYNIEHIMLEENEEDKDEYRYFWNDPEGLTSEKCKIISYPDVSFLTVKAYEKLEPEYYDRGFNTGDFGLLLGVFNNENILFDALEETWFKTKEEREEFIKHNSNEYSVEVTSEEFKNKFNDKAHKEDISNYAKDDGVFLIYTESGSEAEVYGRELVKITKKE